MHRKRPVSKINYRHPNGKAVTSVCAIHLCSLGVKAPQLDSGLHRLIFMDTQTAALQAVQNVQLNLIFNHIHHYKSELYSDFMVEGRNPLVVTSGCKNIIEDGNH